jgi:hypothetical protein
MATGVPNAFEIFFVGGELVDVVTGARVMLAPYMYWIAAMSYSIGP